LICCGDKGLAFAEYFRNNFDYYDIILYVLALNQTESGELPNNAQRTAIWQPLKEKVKTFLQNLQDNKREYLISSKQVKIEPNAHQFHDDTIYLKVTFQIRLETTSC